MFLACVLANVQLALYMYMCLYTYMYNVHVHVHAQVHAHVSACRPDAVWKFSRTQISAIANQEG